VHVALCALQVRSRFTERPGEEQDVGKASSRHLQPFLKCLAHLGFSLQVSVPSEGLLIKTNEMALLVKV